VYTSSAQGIADAFDEAQDALIADYKQLEAAVGQVMVSVEEFRQQLNNANEREEKLIKQRDGALEMAMSDSANQAKHKAAFDRFHAEIMSIEADQKNLEAQIKEQESQLSMLETQLKDIQRELQKMPAEKAQQIAQYVSNKKLMEAYDRINGLKTSYDRGPIEAIRKKNRELSAQAKVRQRVAGIDAKAEDQQYENAGQVAATNSDFEAMLAARKAEKAAASGQEVKKESDRPQI
jgi:chromosome segregation ATPase